jgi:hypothetical protein
MTNSHTLQFTTAHTEVFSVCCVFTSGLSPVAGITSSQAGGHLPPTSCSSKYHLKVKVTLRLTVSQSVSKCWCRAPSGVHDQIFITVWQLQSCFLWGALSGERTGLSFVYVAGSCQRSLSRVRFYWYSRPYYTVSYLRLPFSSPPTTRRVTVEVFDPASARVQYHLKTPSRYIASTWTAQKTPFQTFTKLLLLTQPLASNCRFSGPTVLGLRKYSTIP